MNGAKHPFTGAVYEQDLHGHIVVTTKEGRSGLFTRWGVYISGELEECDPQLCNWVGGPQYGNHRVGSNSNVG